MNEREKLMYLYNNTSGKTQECVISLMKMRGVKLPRKIYFKEPRPNMNQRQALTLNYLISTAQLSNTISEKWPILKDESPGSVRFSVLFTEITKHMATLNALLDQLHELAEKDTDE